MDRIRLAGIESSNTLAIDTVFHAATLHKPHVATLRRQDFIDTNITGTPNLLEEAVSAGISSFI
jgi:UDP-glucose 4-epimerase